MERTLFSGGEILWIRSIRGALEVSLLAGDFEELTLADVSGGVGGEEGDFGAHRFRCLGCRKRRGKTPVILFHGNAPVGCRGN